MISNIAGIAWPPVLAGENATLAALVAELRSTQYMPPDQLQMMQDAQLAEVIKHHAENTPSFSKRLRDQGLDASTISTVNGLKKFAPINKSYIQRTGSGFFCEAVPKHHGVVGKVQTSGSTGEPITVMRTAINQLFWEAFAFRDHEWNNRDYGNRLFAIRANIWQTVSLPVWGLPVSKLHATGPAMGMNVGESVENLMAELRDFQPNILVCHAGVMAAMVGEWERNGLDLTDLRHIKNIGDTVGDDLRDRVRKLTGMEIEDNYSSSETGCIAIQCPEGGQYHVVAESLVVEILNDAGEPCKPGEIGRVVITDLHNTASPVIRYDLGDYAEVGTACGCGRTLPTLQRVIGRERNLFMRPDGTRFYPRAGMYELPGILPIQQWQIIQHAIDHVEYRLVTDSDLTDEHIAAITRVAHDKLQYQPRITVTIFKDRLPVGKGGKFEEAICLIR